MKSFTEKQLKYDHEFQFIIIAGFRYTIGRMSYAPHLVQEWIKKNKDILEENTINVMISDLSVIFERCERMNDYRELGHDCDKESWYHFYLWLRQLKERNEEENEKEN